MNRLTEVHNSTSTMYTGGLQSTIIVATLMDNTLLFSPYVTKYLTVIVILSIFVILAMLFMLCGLFMRAAAHQTSTDWQDKDKGGMFGDDTDELDFV